MKRIHKTRNLFDNIDDQLVKLLIKRLELSKEIGIIKHSLNLPVYDQRREELILQKIKARTSTKHTDSIMRIYESILSESKHTQRSID